MEKRSLDRQERMLPPVSPTNAPCELLGEQVGLGIHWGMIQRPVAAFVGSLELRLPSPDSVPIGGVDPPVENSAG